MNGWFGEEMRGTPMSFDLPEIPVPTGYVCRDCGTEITPADSGVAMPLLDIDGVEQIYQHQECAIYGVLGTRWCRDEGVHCLTPQHQRYHELREEKYGDMRPRAIERRVLLEFGEYVSDEELRTDWKK